MSTAIPRILTHPDILDEVFSHLTPGWAEGDVEIPYWMPSDRKLLRSTLASSALVCRVFSKKALDCLWRVLDSILPLLRILPSTAFRINSDISDAAWTKFQAYARRVRELKSVEPMVRLHSSTWDILVPRLGGAPLLPMLRRLETVIMLPYPTPGILLLSPTLRSLRLSFPQFMPLPEPASDSSILVENIIRAISLPCIPDDVRRKVHETAPEASEHLLALGRFISLRELDLAPKSVRVGPDSLRALSSLGSLRVLRVNLAFGTMHHLASLHEGFSDLNALSLRGTDMDTLKLLQVLPLEKLAELELGTETPMTVEEYRHYLASARSLIPSNLTCLALGPDTFLDSHDESSLAHILQPMLSLRRLSKLTCQFRTYPKDVSDDDLHGLATAWPTLTSFWVMYSYSDVPSIPNQVQPITLAGFIDLLRRCPHLESVGLPTLDVAHLPSAESVPRLDNRVRELAVDRFVGEAEADLPAFALIVDRLLPCLEVPQYITAGGEGTQWVDLWDKVLLLVAPLQAARRVGS
ncbi:hypothetical protein K466DRAFT_665981 [Polyporus arcularius HHB13444]|uniref:F-box domain-containing protein n=1 Tax=Polyporus arcularius HHB13444 TaxID=1314778 RepID=A0A5C3P0Q9_9APHY|nr:hypothetical protein K466DRAFT_665981 [Polyporus arcularius HHB13444]